MSCKLRRYNLGWTLFVVLVTVLIQGVGKGAVASQSSRSKATSDTVGPGAYVSDFAARHLLARLLSYDERTLAEAEAQYRLLLAQRPDGPDVLVEMADLQASLGHIKMTQQLYQRALQLTGQSAAIRLRYAAQMVTWGDFYGAERLYRQVLAAQPGDAQVCLKLAEVLTSAQRYAQAEGIYQNLLQHGADSQQATLGLARLYLQRKDFPVALSEVKQYLQLVQRSPVGGKSASETSLKLARGLRLEGEGYLRMGRYREALASYSRLQELPSEAPAGLLGRGKTLLAAGEPHRAVVLLRQARQLAPKNIEIRYVLAAASGQRVTSDAFVQQLLQTESYSALELVRWGRLYAEHGAYRQAIKFYEAALTKDPQNFHARFNLAETLAIDHQYDQALAQLQELTTEYPGVSKILLTDARALSWARHYEQSVAVYQKMHQQQPADPVPVTEAARTAIWGKHMTEGQKLYATLWQSPVDEQLLQALRTLAKQSGDPAVKQLLAKLEASRKQNSIYQGYEAFVKELSSSSQSASPQVRGRLQQLSLDLLPDYQIQKAGYLESEAKKLVWNRRFTRAADRYNALLEFDPGNEEALFDDAQVWCALGLCDEEAKVYRQLLRIDPLHQQAAVALERQKLLSQPAVNAGYSFWEERGYGELSQMQRQQTELTADIPLHCRYHLQMTAHQWLEDPIGYPDSYLSYGPTLALSGVFNAYLQGAAAWTGHYYEDAELEDQNTGFARLAINLKDYAQLNLGYDRSNQYFNEFAILQGIQANTWWLSLSSSPSRRFELHLNTRYLDYTDDNDAQIYSLGAGYSFTDHPGILKLELSGEYRNTRETNVYHYIGSELVDITHPYWAPQDYLAGIVSLEWYHDLSRRLFCGQELHYYDIRLSTGTDSDDNPLIAVAAQWHYEFADHWTVQLKGLVHRSRQWDANGFWGTVQYRF